MVEDTLDSIFDGEVVEQPLVGMSATLRVCTTAGALLGLDHRRTRRIRREWRDNRRRSIDV